jgi:hypothetical protein
MPNTANHNNSINGTGGVGKAIIRPNQKDNLAISLEDDFPNLSMHQQQGYFNRERRPSANAILQSTTNASGSAPNNNSMSSLLNALTSPSNNSEDSLSLNNHSFHCGVSTTIHVMGLPDDITDREFINMFLFAPGFEIAILRKSHEQQLMLNSNTTSPIDMEDEEPSSPFNLGLPSIIVKACSLGCSNNDVTNNNNTDSPVYNGVEGFARFQTRQDAIDAMDHLNGRTIDLESRYILKAEITKKNLSSSLISHLKQEQPYFQQHNASSPHYFPPSRRQGSLDIYEGFYGGYSNFASPIDGLSASINSPIPNILSPNSFSSSAIPRPQVPPQVNTGRSSISAKLVATTAAYPGIPPALIVGENPPCNTLYVGNLPLTATEQELWVLFSPCRGFKRLSFRLKANGPMCFVEFEDISSATEAMETLYGTMLSCSVKSGIRLSYSKNPLGVRASLPQTPIQYGGPAVVGDEENGAGYHSGVSSTGASWVGYSTATTQPTTPVYSLTNNTNIAVNANPPTNGNNLS